jgi:hypothetical protein
MADEEEDGTIELPTDPLPVRMRVEALQQMVVLAGSDRGPDAVKFEDFKAWCEDTAAWLLAGAWPARKAASVKPIKGGKDAPQAPAGQQDEAR